jgi:hypothetical protein
MNYNDYTVTSEYKDSVKTGQNVRMTEKDVRELFEKAVEDRNRTKCQEQDILSGNAHNMLPG